jgi:integrase
MESLRERLGQMPVRDFTAPVLRAWIEETHRDHPGMARAVIAKVRTAFNHATKTSVALLPREHINPASKLIGEIKWLRGKAGSHAVALEDDGWKMILRGIQLAKDIYEKKEQPINDVPPMHPLGVLLVEFLLVTGARKEETQTLEQSHIVGNIVSKELHKTRNTTGKPRQIILGQNALAVLAEAAKWREKIEYTGPYIFPSVGRRAEKEYICRPDHYAKNIGMLAKLPFKLKCHSLRSIYINFAIDNGVPIAVVAENVGHSSIQTTQKHYMRNKLSKLQAGVDTTDELISKLKTLVS